MLCQHCLSNILGPPNNLGLQKVQAHAAERMKTKIHGRGVLSTLIHRRTGLEEPISYGIKVREMYAGRSHHPSSLCATLTIPQLQIRAGGRVHPLFDSSTLDPPIACLALSRIPPPAVVLPRRLGAEAIVNLWAVCQLLLVRLRHMRQS